VPDILHIGRPTGTGPAVLDTVVHKFGRTSAYTVGRVVSINTDVNVTFSAGTLVFENQILIQGLVAARWVWSDPLADPGMRLSHLIAEGFTQLSQLRRNDIVPLFNEAERYRHWRHPQTTGEV